MQDLEKTIAQTVSAAIEAQAKAGLISALGGVDGVADAIFRTLMTRKVKVDYREIPMLDFVLQQSFTDAMKAVVNDIFNEQRDEIRRLIAARLRTDSKDLANTLVDRMFGKGDKPLYIGMNVTMGGN